MVQELKEGSTGQIPIMTVRNSSILPAVNFEHFGRCGEQSMGLVAHNAVHVGHQRGRLRRPSSRAEEDVAPVGTIGDKSGGMGAPLRAPSQDASEHQRPHSEHEREEGPKRGRVKGTELHRTFQSHALDVTQVRALSNLRVESSI